MVTLSVGRRWLTAQVVLGLLVSLISFVSAEDEPQAKQRLKWMQEALDNLEPQSSELKTKVALTFGSRPLLRYNDPTRGGAGDKANLLLDAGVWRLGTEGRPTALVTVEIYRVNNRSHIMTFEFLSLTKAKCALKHKTEKIRWDPAASALSLKKLPDAPKPAATAATRLVQMRQVARRFVAKEIVHTDSIECRLLTQPIDRYQSEAEKIVDGAIFVYANGTNPELGVVLETDGKLWRYGTLRLTSAASSVTLDGRQVAAYERFDTRGRTDGPYHSGGYEMDRGK